MKKRNKMHKNRVKNSEKAYGEWLASVSGNDSQGLEEMGESRSPFDPIPLEGRQDDVYEALEQMYYGHVLKGRQWQIVSLLMDGVFKYRDIANRLGVDIREVGIHLKRIKEKLEKSV